MSSDVNLAKGAKGAKALGRIVFEVPKTSNIVRSVRFGMNSGFSEQTGQRSVK